MPLSKLEREVLEVIYKEHRQTHRGAREDIVFIAMGAVSCKDKSRILFAMQALNERDLIAARPDAWAPTKEGVNFIEQPGWIGFDMAQAGADETKSWEIHPIPQEGTWLLEKGERVSNQSQRLLSSEDLSLLDRRDFKPEEIKAAQEAAASKWAEDMTRLIMGTDRISDELLNRCAAMNATLLAQAQQAHADGDPEAWRDLHWLIETGKQLVAMRGDS